MQARQPRAYILSTTTGVEPTRRNNWLSFLTTATLPVPGFDRGAGRGGGERRGGAATARVVDIREREEWLSAFRRLVARMGADGMNDMVKKEGVR